MLLQKFWLCLRIINLKFSFDMCRFKYISTKLCWTFSHLHLIFKAASNYKWSYMNIEFECAVNMTFSFRVSREYETTPLTENLQTRTQLHLSCAETLSIQSIVNILVKCEDRYAQRLNRYSIRCTYTWFIENFVKNKPWNDTVWDQTWKCESTCTWISMNTNNATIL